MIYSRWRPDVGGYDYFQDAVTHNLNDDLPEPQLRPASQIGIPSIEAGRPIPAAAVWAGEGAKAVGLVAPVDAKALVRRTRSLALGALGTSNTNVWIAGAAIALVGFGIYRATRKRR